LLAPIQGSAERLADLVANLLDLSRQQVGALHLDPAATSGRSSATSFTT
jgi:signal transduction histidine kinase